jgi:hypothetical protein
MARGSFNIIEQHLEKGVLGLAVLYLLAMFYMFLIRSPNKVDYGGQQVGPRELAAAMEQDVQSLRRAIDNAPQPATDVPNYSVALRAEHEQGIFANTALPKRLPRATSSACAFPAWWRRARLPVAWCWSRRTRRPSRWRAPGETSRCAGGQRCRARAHRAPRRLNRLSWRG